MQTSCILNIVTSRLLICALLSSYSIFCRHQLVPEEELSSLYDLLIDDPPEIRRAIGALVYDNLIAQRLNSSQSSSGFYHTVLHNVFSICLID